MCVLVLYVSVRECVCMCVFSQWNKEGRMSDLRPLEWKTHPRSSQIRTEDAANQWKWSQRFTALWWKHDLLQQRVSIWLICLWLFSCVSFVCLSEYLSQSKQLLLGKCGLYCGSGADLFAHGQMTEGISHYQFWQVELTMTNKLTLYLDKHCTSKLNWSVLLYNVALIVLFVRA